MPLESSPIDGPAIGPVSTCLGLKSPAVLSAYQRPFVVLQTTWSLSEESYAIPVPVASSAVRSFTSSWTAPLVQTPLSRVASSTAGSVGEPIGWAGGISPGVSFCATPKYVTAGLSLESREMEGSKPTLSR